MPGTRPIPAHVLATALIAALAVVAAVLLGAPETVVITLGALALACVGAVIALDTARKRR